MATTLFQSLSTQLTYAKNVTYGTFVTSATDSLPVKTLKVENVYKTLLDENWRGIAAKDFQYRQGVVYAGIDLETLFYADQSGAMLMWMMGADSVSGGNPYTHAVTLASLPSTYDCQDFTTYANRQVGSVFWEEVVLKWATDAEFMVTAKGRGTKAVNTGSQQTFTASTANVQVGWQGALTLNSSSDTNMIDFEMALKRPLELVWGAGSQVPTNAIVGALEVSGKITFAITGNTENALYEAGTPIPLSILFNQAASNQLTIQMTTAALETPTSIERTKIYHTLAASYRGIYNATDSGPVKFSVVNTRSAAFI